MKLQFDPNQIYQHDAIAAVADLFEGQPRGMPEYTVIDMGTSNDDGLYTGKSCTENGVGNNLLLATEKLKENTITNTAEELNELHKLLVDGIKYEKIGGNGSEAEREMLLFKNEELVNYLDALAVSKSPYEYVVYESEVEKNFAKRLDEREDIRLFVKLPSWFEIDTPIGKYNPDWAIVNYYQMLYLDSPTSSSDRI